MISNNPKIAIAEIASLCGITEDDIAYHIKKLKQSGRMTLVGGARYGRKCEVNCL